MGLIIHYSCSGILHFANFCHIGLIRLTFKETRSKQ